MFAKRATDKWELIVQSAGRFKQGKHIYIYTHTCMNTRENTHAAAFGYNGSKQRKPTRACVCVRACGKVCAVLHACLLHEQLQHQLQLLCDVWRIIVLQAATHTHTPFIYDSYYCYCYYYYFFPFNSITFMYLLRIKFTSISTFRCCLYTVVVVIAVVVKLCFIKFCVVTCSFYIVCTVCFFRLLHTKAVMQHDKTFAATYAASCYATMQKQNIHINICVYVCTCMQQQLVWANCTCWWLVAKQILMT